MFPTGFLRCARNNLESLILPEISFIGKVFSTGPAGGMAYMAYALHVGPVFTHFLQLWPASGGDVSERSPWPYVPALNPQAAVAYVPADLVSEFREPVNNLAVVSGDVMLLGYILLEIVQNGRVFCFAEDQLPFARADPAKLFFAIIVESLVGCFGLDVRH